MLIMGSIQLIILGVFGDYLGRLYIESKGRPLFIVREVRSQSRASERGPVVMPLTVGAFDPRV
jgi:dolichol-phosphate mannosyltransferase